MTTPGGQLTPGDDTTPPVYGTPDGAYVGDAGSPNAIHDLNHLTEEEAKRRMQTPLEGTYAAQFSGFWGVINGVLGIVQGAVDLVVGVVDAVVGGIRDIISSVGSLFGLSHQDVSAVDQARVDSENAIAAAMDASLDHLDEVQRFGGAYMGVPTFRILYGEIYPHHVPLSVAVPLESGTRLIPPYEPLTHAANYQYPGAIAGASETTMERIARGSGQLELLESGLWLIQFQVSVLQGNQYPDRPVDLWCHVTPAESPWLPLGPPNVNPNTGNPVSGSTVRHRETGVVALKSDAELQQIGYGRASSYIGDRDTNFSGGNTVSGVVYAYLPTAGWKVNLSCNSWETGGGAMSSYVYATKVNSETLRQDIDQLKIDIATALPGHNVDLLMNEAAISAMVAQSEDLEAPPIEVPPYEEDAGA